MDKAQDAPAAMDEVMEESECEQEQGTNEANDLPDFPPDLSIGVSCQQEMKMQH